MTREEALQAIKAKIDYYESDKRLKAAIETLIPELRESDDERIRKLVVTRVRTATEMTESLRELLLAYLEKQKESLHISETCKENANSFTDEDEKMANAIKLILSEVPMERFDDEGVDYAKCLAYIEKQKTSEEAIRYVKENHSPDEVSDFQAAMNIAAAKAYDKGVQDTLEKKKKELDKMIVVSPEVWDNAISDAYENGKKDGEKRKSEEQKAKERLDRMAPIYNDKESFEAALEKAWKYYNESASRTVDSFEDDYIECVFSKGFREGFLYKEKQKEQKPIIEICPHSIKSKSYKENWYPIEDCDYGLEIAYDILEKTFGEVRGYQTDDGIREHQTAIEAVRKAKEQKPDQSEEEQEYIKTLKGLVSDFVRDNGGIIDVAYYQQICDWLDGRHIEQKPAEPSDDELQRHQDELYNFKVFAAKQAKEHHISFIHDFEWNNFCAELLSYFNEKQKPAEWSNEDEDKMDVIIRLITQNSGWPDRAIKEYVDWLKSLRLQPSWKPSEEQMMDEWLKDRDGCFWDGVEEGKKAMEKQMMEGAVEADVNTYEDLAAGKSWAEFVVEMPAGNLGDKVKIIIIKDDEQNGEVY